MKFWSKLPSGGAAISPATAPSAVASPQPSAIVQLTRIPVKRLDSGFSAAARIASPSFVNRKKSQSTSTASSETPMIPRSEIEKATPAIRIGRVEKAFGIDFTSGDQIQKAAPLTTKKSPIVTIATVSTDARSTGRITTRSSAIPPANEASTVTTKAGQYPKPCWVRVQATNVENIASSPCAKLTTPVAR